MGSIKVYSNSYLQIFWVILRVLSYACTKWSGSCLKRRRGCTVQFFFQLIFCCYYKNFWNIIKNQEAMVNVTVN